MRLGSFVFTACLAIISAAAAAQDYSGSIARSGSSVLRPAATVAWRNYVAVPDGTCGHPMSVQADCYDVCKPCGPLHPVCFLHRVGRMLDCLLPCNLCCRNGGGCGLFHGCHLGGRHWGHCSMCCGGGGGDFACGRPSGCCANPCGSAFADVPCTSGGHCYGCTSTVPMLSDPFIDDPLPPKPTAAPAEVRHAAPKTILPAATHTRVATSQRPTSTTQPRTAATRPPARSPYKVISDPTRSPAARAIHRSSTTTGTSTRTLASPSVLRQTSAESPNAEPAPLYVDPSHAAPIIRSQSPDEMADYAVPHNPLRR
jgi:hypothetical protein